MYYRLILLYFLSYSYIKSNILEDITLLNPHLESEYAQGLCINIKKYSEEYNINYKIILAILRVESNFDMEAVNYESRDFGISQINAINILYHKINLGKLLTDLDYAIKTTAILLRDLKAKYNTNSKGHRQWFTRWHSFTLERREIYYELLKPHLEKIDYRKEDK